MDTLILIPTYNNAGTLADVLDRALSQGLPVLVVDDGSTDATRAILTQKAPFPCPDGSKTATRTPNTPISCPDGQITTTRTPNAPLPCPDGKALYVIHHSVNQGKGRALKTGFEWALEQGYDYVITLDSDGQHFPEDIPTLLAAKAPKTLVVGSRNIQADGMAGSSTFANKFSNFWFTLYTWNKLPDTQTGYRLYPLRALPSLGLLSARYEAELTLLVFSAWKGIKLVPVPVKVDYPEDRVTHFRPGKDFARISILNTILLFVALLYGYPRMLVSKLLR